VETRSQDAKVGSATEEKSRCNVSPSTKRILRRQWIGHWIKQILFYSTPNNNQGLGCTFAARESAPITAIVTRHNTVNSVPFHGADSRTLLLSVETYDYRTIVCRIAYRPGNYDHKIVDRSNELLTFKKYHELDFSFLGRVKYASLESHPLVIVEAK
jgi:hypothetical protein